MFLKKLSVIMVLLLVSCSSTDEIVEQPTNNEIIEDIYIGTDNHLSCRSSSGKNVNALYNKIINSDKNSGVVLYFHGGLSSKEYMKNELGPMLLDSFFKQKEMKGYYPIFVNYDASLFQKGNLLEQIKRIVTSKGYQQGLDKFKGKMGVGSNESISPDNAPSLSEHSMLILDSAIAKNSTNVLVKQHKTHLLWTAQTQLESNHRLMYEA